VQGRVKGFAFAAIAVVVVAFAVGSWLGARRQEPAPLMRTMQDSVITVLGSSAPLRPFTLTDHKGQVFDLESLKGKWTFIFFGYTHCPDVCPTTLDILRRFYEHIEKQPGGTADVQIVFLSVDPKRDSISRLAKYITHFQKDFIGVTGKKDQIDNLSQQVGAMYKIQAKAGEKNYPVSHTSALFLMDPQARHYAIFSPPHDVEAISKRFDVVRSLEKDKQARARPQGLSAAG